MVSSRAGCSTRRYKQPQERSEDSLCAQPQRPSNEICQVVFFPMPRTLLRRKEKEQTQVGMPQISYLSMLTMVVNILNKSTTAHMNVPITVADRHSVFEHIWSVNKRPTQERRNSSAQMRGAKHNSHARMILKDIPRGASLLHEYI